MSKPADSGVLGGNCTETYLDATILAILTAAAGFSLCGSERMHLAKEIGATRKQSSKGE